MIVVGIETREQLSQAWKALRAKNGALTVEMQLGADCADCGHRISRGERARFRWEKAADSEKVRLTHELGCK